ncbi:histidine phosphatase family protein [Azospira restricta]|nr:histidine phosphatase family protein [Azospira restricta]
MPLSRTRRSLCALLAGGLLAGAAPGGAAAALPLTELAKPGRVLMLRHALAPGNGDPPGFVAGDCATQRNLDATGRAQARALGGRLRAAGIAGAQVYSSEWCRCLETARLLGLGPVTPLPALNSFYGQAQARERIIGELRAFLARLPVDGPPVILVTHQLTINAFTDAGTPSGGGSIFQLDGSGTPRRLGDIAVD